MFRGKIARITDFSSETMQTRTYAMTSFINWKKIFQFGILYLTKIPRSGSFGKQFGSSFKVHHMPTI